MIRLNIDCRNSCACEQCFDFVLYQKVIIEIFPRIICTLIRKYQAPCKIYPIFFRVATREKAGFHKENQNKMGAIP